MIDNPMKVTKSLLNYITLFFLISCTKSSDGPVTQPVVPQPPPPPVVKVTADFEATLSGKAPAATLNLVNKSEGADSFLWIFSHYANNPQKLANLVYANRMGNGSPASGDGYNFRGRGLLHITGRGTYTEFNNFYNNKYGTNIDIISNPGLVSSDHTLAVLSGLWYYKNKVLDKMPVDSNTSVKEVTKKVNGGTNGLPDRERIYNSATTNVNCN